MPLPRLRAGLVAAASVTFSVSLLCSLGVAPADAKPRSPDFGIGAAGGVPDDRARAKKRVVVPTKVYGPLGIDVSGWQPTVDWKGWWAKGRRWAYVKATEGTSYRAKTFRSQYADSYNAGYIRGAYHYANPGGKSGWRQADYFIKHGGGWTADGRTLPGMLDVESSPYRGDDMCYGRSKARMVRWINSFVKRYRKRTGRAAVIYTNAGWWQECTGNTTKFAETNPLFLARWNTTPGTSLPGGWKTWTFWQYTDSPIDQDMFNGSYAQLKAYAKGTL